MLSRSLQSQKLMLQSLGGSSTPSNKLRVASHRKEDAVRAKIRSRSSTVDSPQQFALTQHTTHNTRHTAHGTQHTALSLMSFGLDEVDIGLGRVLRALLLANLNLLRPILRSMIRTQRPAPSSMKMANQQTRLNWCPPMSAGEKTSVLAL